MFDGNFKKTFKNVRRHLSFSLGVYVMTMTHIMMTSCVTVDSIRKQLDVCDTGKQNRQMT